jgi:hypothetical protein
VNGLLYICRADQVEKPHQSRASKTQAAQTSDQSDWNSEANLLARPQGGLLNLENNSDILTYS